MEKEQGKSVLVATQEIADAVKGDPWYKEGYQVRVDPNVLQQNAYGFYFAPVV
jgi:hypothetical protein